MPFVVPNLKHAVDRQESDHDDGQVPNQVPGREVELVVRLGFDGLPSQDWG